MKCPYCDGEMIHGEITADGRRSLRFQREGQNLTFGDLLCGVGRLTAVQNHWMIVHAPADYCPRCKKLIIETEVAT